MWCNFGCHCAHKHWTVLLPKKTRSQHLGSQIPKNWIVSYRYHMRDSLDEPHRTYSIKEECKCILERCT